MNRFLSSLPFRLLVAIALGVAVGLTVGETAITVVQSVRHLTGQVVFFAVPLIILGFVAPSIARSGADASRLLGVSLGLGYGSAVAAALLAALTGFALVPGLSVPGAVDGGRALPEMLFELTIAPIMPTMSALVLALLLGLAVSWTRARRFAAALDELHRIVLAIVTRVVVPVLPVFIASVFALLAYQGGITRQVPVFLQALGVVVAVHVAWIAVLYVAAAAYSRRNPFDVVRHYGAAYLTAVGTMSSAATLPVALKGASASRSLDKRMVDFGVPLLAHVHMPGSVISITFLAMTVSQVLYGELPAAGTMLLFVVLLGVFAVAAPGVPGGTLMASLGLVTTVLGFDEAGTGLMLAIFALQDSFGTAANITSDGPLLMILSRYAQRRGIGARTPSAAPAREAAPAALAA
ncbi:cation:dicarboxylate symporter family transporter [Xylanimonas allomyrinae]|uniref:cation:dicarboxylate symporter family transporter n=1 Tax=Xylanimonas allomyrinae TaxID=2509459 RepID=UPI001B883DAD|nr:cation:dicarboxylase symporter family transporter [Xylanimonas allomyrinae]